MEPTGSGVRSKERDDCIVPWPVHLWGPDRDLAAAVREGLRQEGSVCVEPGQPRERDGGHTGSEYGVVLLGIGTASACRAIQFHKQRGSALFCLVSGSCAQRIDEYSALFVAGADYVIDSSSSDWMVRLSTAILRTAERSLCRRQEDVGLRASLSELGIVAESAALLATFRRVRQIARVANLPVLITGETGTGKESVARAIHRLDPGRCGKRFLAVNSATLNRETAESDLFGHRRGAFTGADRDRDGLFRAADGGVLFLDEVGELSLGLQARLLRVVEEQWLFRMGDENEIHIDVRVIAATNRDLKGLMHRGEFREDLYHRLNGLSVHVPPLRERPDDIPALVDHFLRKHGHLAAPIVAAGADPAFILALQSARLTGNAREVENLIRNALVALDRSRALEMYDLSPEFWAGLVERPQEPAAEAMHVEAEGQVLRLEAIDCLQRNGWDLPRSVQAIEDILVAAAVEHYGGNRTRAAERLGITRRTVQSKLRRKKMQRTQV